MRSRDLILCLTLLACTPQQRAQMAAEGLKDVSKDAMCVLTAVADGGIDDPMLIAQRCAGATLSQIAQLAGEWLSSVTDTDAGSVHAAPTPMRVRFAAVRDRANALLADGGK